MKIIHQTKLAGCMTLAVRLIKANLIFDYIAWSNTLGSIAGYAKDNNISTKSAYKRLIKGKQLTERMGISHDEPNNFRNA